MFLFQLMNVFFLLVWVLDNNTDLGHVHTNTFSFENVYFSLRFWPSIQTEMVFLSRKGRFLKTLSKVDTFKNSFRVVVWTVKT